MIPGLWEESRQLLVTDLSTSGILDVITLAPQGVATQLVLYLSLEQSLPQF